MRFFLLFLSFCLSVGFHAQAGSGLRPCSTEDLAKLGKLLKNPWVNLQVGDRHYVYFQRADIPVLLELTFLGQSEDGAYLFYTGKKEIKVEKHDLINIVRRTKNDLEVSERLHLANSKRDAEDIELLEHTAFRPGLKKDHLEITGDDSYLASSGVQLEAHQALLGDLISFERAMKSMGFIQRDPVKIILSEKAKSDMYFAKTIKDPLDGQRKRFILLKGEGKACWNCVDRDVVMHERAHDLIVQKFSEESILNESATLSEAFADLLSLHYSDKAKLEVTNENGVKVAVRDLSLRREYEEKIEGNFFSPLPFINVRGQVSEHSLGQVVSHLAWRIRERVGKKQFSQDLPAIMQLINDNAYLVEQNLALFDPKSETYSRNKEFMSVELALAALKAKYRDAGDSQWVQQIVDESVSEFRFSKSQIDYYYQLVSVSDDML